MCHVMWLDVFRTPKETLIPWQPGNVLMKDTQGIVSAEEVCYSCHDGYVVDSRSTAWKGNNHTTFKKPSSKIKIPMDLPLSNKDELYCGTCHSPHGGRETVPGGSPEESIPGPMSFLRLPNTDSSLCETCHVNETDYKRTHSHPLHTDKLAVPDTLFAQGSRKAKNKNMVTCQTCHKVHGAKGKNLTVLENRQSELCMACHPQRVLAGTLHDLRVSMPGQTNIKGQTLSESGPCGACHIPHQSTGFKLWARAWDPAQSPSQVCLSCHTGKPESKTKGIGRYSHPTLVAVNSKEKTKAGSLQPTDKLPLFLKTGEKTRTGLLQCFTCHDIHQWDPASPTNKGGKNIEGNGSNSFLRLPTSRSSALCMECHRDKRQLLTSDHNLALTDPESINQQGFTPGISGPCGACHIPHNAMGNNLWARDNSEGYCLGCHGENSKAKGKRIGKNSHPVDVISKGPGIPPADGIRLMLPLYNLQGEKEKGDRILCHTCHDPHIWTVSNNNFNPSKDLDEPSGVRDKNTEGDARTSFLRQPASPKPDLCVVCHKDTALLLGTDHDLTVSAPTAKNIMGQSVNQSGLCGVCHATHNSPNHLLLWAQPLGPASENQHPMNGVCTGCHSKGGIAETKIPPVDKHPPGQLITNQFTINNLDEGYIKLFNRDCKEVRVGDLSCSSCHSFFQWDHRMKNPGPGITIEGDAKTSFLRTSSDNTVCMDCHGETAIWRYTYFHSLKKREMIKDRMQQDE